MAMVMNPTAPTMRKRIRMGLKSLRVGLATAALLVLLPQAGPLLAGAQQATSGGISSGVTSKTRSGGAGAAGGSGLGTVPEDFVKLRLAPGFMLSLTILDDPDFTGSFRIDQLGNITVPILGTMYVAGETVGQARLQLRNSLLESRTLNDPQVELAVVEYIAPEVTIIGEVASPGKFPVLAPRKLVDVLALAGGITLTAGNEVQITHGSTSAAPVLVHYSRTTDPKLVESVMVEPGDTVQVKRAGIVYVMGAVGRPGGYVMQEQGTLNVMQAIALAYGTTTLASIGKIYLLRQNADGSILYVPVPYKKIIHVKRADMQLYATDILYVPTSTIKSIYGSTSGIINTLATAAIYTTI